MLQLQKLTFFLLFSQKFSHRRKFTQKFKNSHSENVFFFPIKFFICLYLFDSLQLFLLLLFDSQQHKHLYVSAAVAFNEQASKQSYIEKFVLNNTSFSFKFLFLFVVSCFSSRCFFIVRTYTDGGALSKNEVRISWCLSFLILILIHICFAACTKDKYILNHTLRL